MNQRRAEPQANKPASQQHRMQIIFAFNFEKI